MLRPNISMEYVWEYVWESIEIEDFKTKYNFGHKKEFFNQKAPIFLENLKKVPIFYIFAQNLPLENGQPYKK